MSNTEFLNTDPFDAARAAADYIAEETGVDSHDVALVLGSGWGDAADLIGETTATLSADEVPGFHAPAVEGHVGTIRSVLTKEGKRALVLGARTHYYEGKGVRAVVHGVRTAAAAGCKVLVVTNGCGGLNEDWAPGTPVLIKDHINLTATSPLEGATFVDLTDLYSARIRGLAREVDPPSTRASTRSSPDRTTRRRRKCSTPSGSVLTWWACPQLSKPSPPVTQAWRSSASRW